MSKKNILVVGSKGQLGSELKLMLSKSGNIFDSFFVDREELNITDKKSVDDFFKHNKIDYCVNAAAYTDVNKAEIERDLAFAVNVAGPKNLAMSCKMAGVTLFHISTDYVFDGKKGSPYTELDAVNPLNWYGKTKVYGEQEVFLINQKTFIVRTSWLYSSFGSNFVKTVLKKAKENKILNIVSDQFGSPTYAKDLARIIIDIIIFCEKSTESRLNFGIYHYSNEGVTSWYDFAKEIIRLAKIDCEIKSINSSQYITSAPRPAYSALDSAKIKNTFMIKIPSWKFSLKKAIKNIL